MVEGVTAEDLARDLGADLALLAACKPDADWCEGPGLHVMEWADGHGVFSDDNDLLAAVDNNLAMGLRSEPYARMFAASYTGWPAAIRLALHWKAEADRAKVSAALEAVRAEGAYAEGVKAGVGMERQRARQLRDAIREWNDSTDADLAS